MSIRAHEGNVTIITAMTACMMMLIILLATGLGESAAGSTKMQASGDGAALTAASAYIMAFNDNTLIETIRWAVTAVYRLGTAMQVVGAVLVTIGAATSWLGGAGLALVAAGQALISIGTTVANVGRSMKNAVNPILDAAKKVVDIAKIVLAYANSTIIASNNGYFGFMLPTSLSFGGLKKYDMTDVNKIVGHSKLLTTDSGTVDCCFSTRPTIKETIRRAAVRDLWGGGTDGSNGTPIELRGHNTFHVWNTPTPLCVPTEFDAQGVRKPNTWVEVGIDPTSIAAESGGGVSQGTPIKRDCNEFHYLKQLLDRQFNNQIADLKTLRARITADTWDDQSNSTSSAYSAIDGSVSDLQNVIGGPPTDPTAESAGGSGAQTAIFPDVPGGKNNQQWANWIYNYYNSKDRGQACKDADAAKYTKAGGIVPYGDGSDINNQTFFGCFTKEAGNFPVTAASAPAPHALKFSEDKKADRFFWWTGEQPRDVQTGDAGDFDFRNIEPYIKDKKFLGDAEGLYAYFNDPNQKYGHTVKGLEAKNPITFLEFKKLDPTYSAQLTGRLTGQEAKTQYSVGMSMVDVIQAEQDNDVITFKNFCTKIFGEGPTYGFLGIPSNGAGWCTAFADILIGAAKGINAIPEPFHSILTAIFGDPPDVKVYHAVLHVPNSSKEICEVLSVLREVEGITGNKDTASAVADEVHKVSTSGAPQPSTSC